MTDPTETELARRKAEADLASLDQVGVDDLANRRRAALDASFASKAAQLSTIRENTDINGNPLPPAA